MTYNKLLAKIDYNFTNCSPDCESCESDNAPWFALRAVVEFHKPFDFQLGGEMYTSCEGCGQPDYPCPTIQAIEKKLK